MSTDNKLFAAFAAFFSSLAESDEAATEEARAECLRNLNEAREISRQFVESFAGPAPRQVHESADIDVADRNAMINRVLDVLVNKPKALKTLAKAIDRYYDDAARVGKPARTGITVYLSMS